MLVVRQMQGSWRVKHPNMRPLHRQALDACEPIRNVQFKWIPREENWRADELSKMGMKAAHKCVRL